MAADENKVRPAKAKTATEALITGIALIAALILSNVVAAYATRSKIDLTKNGIYSLSLASRDMVRALDEKVNVKAYFGNVPVTAEANQQYVEALLEEYRDASGGKIAFEKIDPTGDPKLQEELKKDGVDKLKFLSRQADKKEEVKMYFHVVFSYLDKNEVWTPSGGFSLEGLEYEFSFRIKRLAHGKKKVGITTGFGEPAHTQALMLEGKELLPGIRFGLADIYQVQPIDWSKDPAQIDGVDILVVNGPTKPVSDAAKLRLDQHIMQGKPVLFFVRGMKWESAGNPQLPPEMQEDQPYTGMPNDDGLKDLLAHIGVEVQANTIIDPRNSALGAIPPGTRNALARGFFPVATVLPRGPRQMLQGMDRIVTPWASSLKLVGPLEKGDGYEIVPVFRSQPTAFAREGVLPIVRDFRLVTSDKDVRGPHLLAVAVTGKWRSFYADKPPPEGVEELAAESPSNTRILVVASPGIAEDLSLADTRFHGDFSYANGFVATHNLVDWLAEDTTLIATRSKVVERPLDELEDSTRTLIKLGNIAGPPLALALFGLGYWLIRERKRKNVRI